MDESEFRVSASDTKGHNSRLWFRCQPGHAQQLDNILQSRRYPYRTKGDILRHALLRHMIWLEEIAPVRSILSQVDAILEVMRDEEFASDFQHVFDKLGERIANHMGQGSDGEARRLILTVMRHISDMPDGYWKDKYTMELENRYGHLLKNAARMKLAIVEQTREEVE